MAVIDEDYDSFLGIKNNVPGLIATDTHDIETLLLASPALDKVLAEYGDPGQMQQYRELSGKTIREGLLDIASLFGKLRLVNAREGLSVPFSKSLSRWKYVHEKTWTVDAARLLSDFANLAGKSLQDITTLVNSCPSLLSGSWSKVTMQLRFLR